MLNDDIGVVSYLNGRGGEKLGVERVELVRVGVRPQRHSLDPTNHLKGVRKCVHNLLTSEAIPLLAEGGERGRAFGLCDDDFERFFVITHGRAVYLRPPVLDYPLAPGMRATAHIDNSVLDIRF